MDKTTPEQKGLPADFVERLRRIVPQPAFSPILESFSLPKTTTFRVNPLKSDAQTLQSELLKAGLHPQPVDWLPGAFRLPTEEKRLLTETDAFYEGRLYIQNLSSMLAPLLLAPQPGERILDLAAAPGGKTLMMAGIMEDRGWISAVEPVSDRFHRLRRNLENAGTAIVHTYRKDGRGVGRACPLQFDRVLLDAPCSSEAKFRSAEPRTFAYWSLRKIRESQKLQKRLILSAWQSLKPGGTLLYSTCSFAPEENEAVVDFLLTKASQEAVLLPVDLPISNTMEGLTEWGKRHFSSELRLSRRILPDGEMDGFFLAKIRKRP